MPFSLATSSCSAALTVHVPSPLLLLPTKLWTDLLSTSVCEYEHFRYQFRCRCLWQGSSCRLDTHRRAWTSSFEPTATPAAALQKLLTVGPLTSVQILNEYYGQILDYNGYLKAVYQLAPGALDRAKELDAKRANGDVLGPLHGIPVLLKASITNLLFLGGWALKKRHRLPRRMYQSWKYFLLPEPSFWAKPRFQK
ncbi:hypothetical protein K458DRAFT_52056 [Lentithecium fluviatile CBS 122367]|uniref:Amidase domain-containing protein n=1 Tax=Lentithecium fluviatile CBS 122367 TaxID=1168545 RepID=A0A6G1IX95_9PLEO|nr:hypothetical protein K458DRAFT_52056 [Lentithecium fluviatile CBS 122367]